MARANRAVLGDFSIRIRAMPKPACRHRRGGDWPAPSSSGHLQFFFHVLGLAYTVRSLYSAHPLALKILFASALGEHLLVLNKREDAVELLENRSHKYSDRTTLPVVDMYLSFCMQAQGHGSDRLCPSQDGLEWQRRDDAVREFLALAQEDMQPEFPSGGISPV